MRVITHKAEKNEMISPLKCITEFIYRNSTRLEKVNCIIFEEVISCSFQVSFLDLFSKLIVFLRYSTPPATPINNKKSNM